MLTTPTSTHCVALDVRRVVLKEHEYRQSEKKTGPRFCSTLPSYDRTVVVVNTTDGVC